MVSGQPAIISKVNFPYCHPAGSLKTLSHEDSGVGLFDITSGDSFPWSGLLTWDPFTIGFCLFYFYVCMFCFGKVSLEYGQIQNDFLVCSMSRPDWHVRFWQTGACTQPVICRDSGARLLFYPFFALFFLFLMQKKISLVNCSLGIFGRREKSTESALGNIPCWI